MTAPVITIKSVSRTKISNKPGLDASEVIFTADQDLVDWEARAGGEGVGQGLLVGKAVVDPIPHTWNELDVIAYTWNEFDGLLQTWDQLDDRRILVPDTTWDELDARAQTWDQLDLKNENWDEFDGRQATFIVEDEELTLGDKTYRINVYGKNEAGEWTPYG